MRRSFELSSVFFSSQKRFRKDKFPFVQFVGPKEDVIFLFPSVFLYSGRK